MTKPNILLCWICCFSINMVAGAGDNITPILNITKCFGLGLENLTPEDITNIIGLFNLSNPNLNLNTIQLVQAQGFPVESHFVTTNDGYILNLFRIPKKNPLNGVVFLQHGLLSSSDGWLLNYRVKNLPYILSNAGYDVWLGNSRGNVYSRNHTFLNPNLPLSKFWDFSWHEMGVYDVPANIDYILEKTGAKKLIYIGHSQGTTQFFAGMSTNEAYNDKIRLMVALAPPEFMNATYTALRALATVESPGIIDDLLSAIGTDGTGAVFSSSQDKLLNALLPFGCNSAITTNAVCNSVLFLIMGYDYYQVQNELIPVAFNHIPQGASMKSIIHYAQLMNNNNFQPFDYGPSSGILSQIAWIGIQIVYGLLVTVQNLIEYLGLPTTPFTKLSIPTNGTTPMPEWLITRLKMGNEQVYGSNTVPQYNLSKVTAPVVLYVGPNDALATVSGVQNLAPLVGGNIDKLKTIPFRTVPYECFNHADFNAISRDINALLYSDIMKLLVQY